MLARSSRRFFILSLTAFASVLVVLQYSSWGHDKVFEVSSLFESMSTPAPKALIHWGDAVQSQHAKIWQYAAKYSVSDANLFAHKTAATGQVSTLYSSYVESSTPTATSPSKTLISSPATPRSSDMKDYVKKMLNWNRPTWDGHWPPYNDYVHKGYDPNRWEQFPMDHRFYDSGHDKLSDTVAPSPTPYKPFPEYNARSWKRDWKGTHVPCIGPRNLPLNESSDDVMVAYGDVPAEFPPPYVGSYDVVGLDSAVCFDRYSRYGPYGLGDEAIFPSDVATHWSAPAMIPKWTKVRWGELQNDCLARNKERYRPEQETSTAKIPSTTLPVSTAASSAYGNIEDTNSSNLEGRSVQKQNYHRRTAILIRTWTGYAYEENDIMAIRAMISELSLQSGAEYQVFLFVNVKDSSLPIFDDQNEYDRVLRENVPEELQDIAILWSESIFPNWYPKVTDWQVYWQQFMCLQWFSLTHPEFDFVWNWETDARYTGHHYHFLEKIGEFADKQPRKLLWERNKRFYIPSVHGNYQSFIQQTHQSIFEASYNSLIPSPVWGPRPWAKAEPPQKPLGPTPPTSFEEDNFEWGINEPADLITLLPMWDPRNTTWSYKDKIWNYLPDVRPVFTSEDGYADSFTHSDFAHMDRRVFINTVVRLSKRMLQAMHEENLVGRSMQAEMWPATVALQHGLKAVYAPHPIFTDRHWPAPYSAAIFDTASSVDEETGAANQSRQGAWTEEADSPYNHDREHNFFGWSWYYASDFPRKLYRRWLGMEIVTQNWGESERVEGGPDADGPHGEKRMCLPGMLLHPVKNMGKDRIK